MPLGGALRAPSAWQAYKARFVTDQGRVVDTGNNEISHSEGQGYGMLIAVAAGDRATFDRIWGWTRANLMVRDDELIAWRWEPRKRPGVADMNDASDGDILVAWALAEAARALGRHVLSNLRTTHRGRSGPQARSFQDQARRDSIACRDRLSFRRSSGWAGRESVGTMCSLHSPASRLSPPRWIGPD